MREVATLSTEPEKNVKVKENRKKRCFVMMPISDNKEYPDNHFSKIYKDLFKPAIEGAGYEAVRVDEDNICDSIIFKILDYIQNCEMCLCDLSSRNPNVLYELGLRQAYDKSVVLVKDDLTDNIFDVSGINTVKYRSSRLYDEVMEDRDRIKEALIATEKEKSGYQSIMKLVQAQPAEIKTGNITDQEKIEIMLSRMQNDINIIKRSNCDYNVRDTPKIISNNKSRMSTKQTLQIYRALKNDLLNGTRHGDEELICDCNKKLKSLIMDSSDEIREYILNDMKVDNDCFINFDTK